MAALVWALDPRGHVQASNSLHRMASFAAKVRVWASVPSGNLRRGMAVFVGGAYVWK